MPDARPTDEPGEADPPRDSHGFTDAEHDTLTELIRRNPERVNRLLYIAAESGAWPGVSPETEATDLRTTLVGLIQAIDGVARGEWGIDDIKADRAAAERALVGGRPAAPTDLDGLPVLLPGEPIPGERAAYDRWRETGDADAAAALDEFDARRRSSAPTRDEIHDAIADALSEHVWAHGTGEITGDGINEAADAVVALLSRPAAEPPIADFHQPWSRAIAVLGELIDWFGAPDWDGPELPADLGKRVADVMGLRGVAAEPKEPTDG